MILRFLVTRARRNRAYDEPVIDTNVCSHVMGQRRARWWAAAGVPTIHRTDMSFPPANYNVDVLPMECEAPRPRWQEWFSWAFVKAVGSAAGLVVHVPGIDANKKDIVIETWHPFEGRVRTIGLQLKST